MTDTLCRVTVMVDDRNLGKFLRLCVGNTYGEPKIEPVVGATVKDGQVRQSEGSSPHSRANTGSVNTEQLLAKVRAATGDTGKASLKDFNKAVESFGVSDKAAYYHVMKLMKMKLISHSSVRGVYNIKGV